MIPIPNPHGHMSMIRPELPGRKTSESDVDRICPWAPWTFLFSKSNVLSIPENDCEALICTCSIV
jgi:hypothetical protein